MRIIIHRGADEIGASCVEVAYGTTRILLDAGTSLDGSVTVFPDDINDYSAVIISHGHQDHYGLLESLPESVELYMGDVAWGFMQSLRIFTGQPPLAERSRICLKAERPFKIGEIVVMPYLVDHSAPEAFGFLLSAGGRTIYYSGDFRAHGRKAKTFDYLCDRLPREMDAVLLEGTLIDRGNSHFSDESKVEEGMIDAIGKEEGLVCLSCSAQNIDRMVTAFRAAKRSGRVLALDIYSAWILRVAQKLSKNIPDIRWDGIRVLSHNKVASGQYRKIKENSGFFGDFVRELYHSDNELWEKDIVDSPSRYLLKLSDFGLAHILQKLRKPSTVIYSQWSGYLDHDSSAYNESAGALKALAGERFYEIHTSGHATKEDLERFVSQILPKTVIPLHTNNKHMFGALFSQTIVLDDGEVFDLAATT